MLVAYTVSLDLIRILRPIASLIAQHDREESRQLVSAASSIVRNIAEGDYRRGRDRARFFAYAAGSASEVRGSLDLAEGWGWISEAADARALLNRLLGLLWGLTHKRG